MRRWLVALLLVSAPATAGAQTVRLNLTPEATRLASELGVEPSSFQSMIEDSLRAYYRVLDVDDFLRLSSNAQSISNKGLGVDYTTSFDSMLFGISVGAAVATNESDLRGVIDREMDFDTAIPAAAGAQLALMLGYRASDALFVYASGMVYPVSVSGLKGSGHNFGVHAQYRLFADKGNKWLAEWGGLALTSGIEISKTSVSLQRGIEGSLPVSGLRVATETLGRIQLTQRAVTIPVELTTSLRLLYVLSLFAGVGADIQLGSSSIQLDVASDLSTTRDGERVDLGDAQVEYVGENGPDAVALRLLGGLQANLGPLAVFAQLNMYPRDVAIGVAGGLRVAF